MPRRHRPLPGGSPSGQFVPAFVLSIALVSLGAGTTAPVPADGQVSAEAAPEPPAGGVDARPHGGDLEGRPRGRGRGPLGEADMERLVAVIADISPEWASSLRTRLAEDPDAARDDFRRYGRRLYGLVMLKERNPPLYAVRVAELALKKGMKERAIEYHQVLGVDAPRAEAIASLLREMAAESVDLELRARAMELEALDQAVRELRERLLGEVADRESRIETVWKALLDQDPSQEPDDPLGGFGERGRPPFDGPRPATGPDRS